MAGYNYNQEEIQERQVDDLKEKIKGIQEENQRLEKENEIAIENYSKLETEFKQLKSFHDAIFNELLQSKSFARKALADLDRCGYVLRYEILDGE